MQFSIGADPEVFLSKSGSIISAHGLIPGNKRKPAPVHEGAIQVDGLAAEFNIDPVDLSEGCANQFVKRVGNVMETLRTASGVDFSQAAYHKFGKDYFDAQPEEAKELGCDADYNAYTQAANPAPPEGTTSRCVGGHVHLGWGTDFDLEDGEHIQSCIDVTKQLDIALGLPSVLEDDDEKRRSLYGRAGSFRIKPYGVEYRSLSNYWIFTEELRQKIYDRTLKAMEDMKKGVFYFDTLASDAVQAAINTSNKSLAKGLLNDLRA